jgi:hypothetical protein
MNRASPARVAKIATKKLQVFILATHFVRHTPTDILYFTFYFIKILILIIFYYFLLFLFLFGLPLSKPTQIHNFGSMEGRSEISQALMEEALAVDERQIWRLAITCSSSSSSSSASSSTNHNRSPFLVSLSSLSLSLSLSLSAQDQQISNGKSRFEVLGVFGVMGWRYGLQNQAFISLELTFHVHGDFGLVVEMEKVRRQSGFGGGGAAAATVDVVGGRRRVVGRHAHGLVC